MRTFLHVGCGQKRKPNTTPAFNTPDWSEIRFDIDPAAQPDIVGTMLDMAAVPARSADAIYSSHNIEHVYAHEVPTVLKEFRRVLKPDGFVVIVCPDLQSVATYIAQGHLTDPLTQTPAGPVSAHDTLYGYGPAMERGQLYMAHRCGFIGQTLLQALEKAGFAGVGVTRRPDKLELRAIASMRFLPREEMKRLLDAHFPAEAPA